MVERFKAPVLKTGMVPKHHRGFESLSLLQFDIEYFITIPEGGLLPITSYMMGRNANSSMIHLD